MKRVIFWSLLIAALFIIVFKTTLLTDVFILLVMGVIPGTEARVPAAVMMIAYPLLAAGALYWLSRQPMFIGDRKHNDAIAREIARKRVHKVSKNVSKKQQLPENRRRYRTVKV